MKRTVLALLSATLLPLSLNMPTADAYHMHDYKLGNVEVYGGFNVTPYNTLGVPDKHVQYSGGEKRLEYYGAMVGLGGNWAFEYRYANNNLDSHLHFSDVGYTVPPAMDRQDFTGEVSTQEYRLRYKVNRYLTVHIEDYHVDGKATLGALGSVSAKHDRILVGAQYGRTFDKRAKSAWWVGVGLGDRLQHAEIGVTYGINAHLNLDVSYQYTNVDRIANIHGMNMAVASQGIYTGLSYRF